MRALDARGAIFVAAVLLLLVRGLLHVSAREKDTGLEKSIDINNAISRFAESDLGDAKERIDALFHDRDTEGASEGKTAGGHQAEVKARAVAEKAERLLDGASDEDREEMIDLIEAINDALHAGNLDALDEPVEQLAEILYYLES